MNRHIEKIHENNAKIRTNEAYIQENKQAIESLNGFERFVEDTRGELADIGGEDDVTQG